MGDFWRVGRSSVTDARTDLFWLIGLALVMVGAGFGLRDPWPADEPRFALIARDMVRTGRWWEAISTRTNHRSSSGSSRSA
jgi:hypothetical protein